MDLEGEGKHPFHQGTVDIASLSSNIVAFEDYTTEAINRILDSSLWVPESAANQINKLFPSNGSHSNKEAFLWILWELIIRKAQMLDLWSRDHEMLISTIMALCKMEIGTVKVFGFECSLWSDLPFLGPCMREAWIDPTLSGGNVDKEQKASWRNLNAFAAKLLGWGLVGWSNLAIWQLRTAFEQDGDFVESRVEAAAQWLLYAGDQLYHECKQSLKLDEVSKDASAPGPRFHGESGFTRQRFEFWQVRLMDSVGITRWWSEPRFKYEVRSAPV